jgi:hypothetical protein
VHQATADADAASHVFNLHGYVVHDVRRDEHGGREVFISGPAVEADCPDCGVPTGRAHRPTVQSVRVAPFDALFTVQWMKRRWHSAAPRRTRRDPADRRAPAGRSETRHELIDDSTCGADGCI